jgi:hypothetical protein
MGKIVGVIVGLIVYWQTGNILIAAPAGALAWIIVDAVIGAIKGSVKRGDAQ